MAFSAPLPEEFEKHAQGPGGTWAANEDTLQEFSALAQPSGGDFDVDTPDVGDAAHACRGSECVHLSPACEDSGVQSEDSTTESALAEERTLANDLVAAPAELAHDTARRRCACKGDREVLQEVRDGLQ